MEFEINTRLECLKIANTANMAIGEWSLIDLAKHLSDFVFEGVNKAEVPFNDTKGKEGNTTEYKVAIDISEVEPKLDLLKSKVKSITLEVSKLVDTVKAAGSVTDAELSRRLSEILLNVINAQP